MSPRGRHALPTAKKLLAFVMAALVTAGIAVATGTASAHRPEARNVTGSTDSTFKGGQLGAPGHGQHGQQLGGQTGTPTQTQPAQPAADPFPGRDKAGPPSKDDFIDIRQVPRSAAAPKPGPKASTGSFNSLCGTNGEGHRNSDNYMVSPGKRNGAQHVHDYVGNNSAVDAFATNQSLADGGTTCVRGDRSVYFWPVLRATDQRGPDANADGGGKDGNIGAFIRPAAVDLQFRGNPTSKVRSMPRFLMIITGDAKAVTRGTANARAQWTCTGFTDRITTKYPLCPKDTRLVRILDFASCWDGKNLDSANHRDHMKFPGADGACPAGTVAVPQLRMVLSYDRPNGRNFAVDSFPDQRHAPITDHADFHNVMSVFLMARAVSCINRGRNC